MPAVNLPLTPCKLEYTRGNGDTVSLLFRGDDVLLERTTHRGGRHSFPFDADEAAFVSHALREFGLNIGVYLRARDVGAGAA